MTQPLASERGSVLLASAIICVVVTAGILTSLTMSRLRVMEGVHTMGQQQSQISAESAVEDVLRQLRDPQLNSWLPINSTHSISMSQATGQQYVVSLSRKNPDISLVDVEATGYFKTGKGPEVNASGQNVQKSVVKAVLRVLNTTEFLAVTPSTLEIAYGSDINTGRIYAGILKFKPQNGAPFNPTRVKEAFHFQSVENDQSGDVVFSQLPNNSQKLLVPMRFASLDQSYRLYYESKTTTPDSNPGIQILAPGSTFDGVRGPPPNPAPNVYYCDGDLHIGSTLAPLTVSGAYVIYVTKTAKIENSILLSGTDSWVAILAEKNIIITDNAPDNLQLRGNFYTNGKISASNPPRDFGTIDFEGGMVTPQGVDLAAVYKQSRVYQHRVPPANSNISLPNIALQLEFRVNQGKHSR